MTHKLIGTDTLWVCVDCYEAHHGTAEDGPDHDDHPEPLCLVSDDESAEVAAGLMWDEHDAECVNRTAREWLDECECEHMTFTWSACQGCGSHLGGAREALTVFRYETDTTIERAGA